MGGGSQRHAAEALLPGKGPCAHWMGGWVSHRAGLDGYGKSRTYQNSISGPSSSQRVPVPTEPSRPTSSSMWLWENQISCCSDGCSDNCECKVFWSVSLKACDWNRIECPVCQHLNFSKCIAHYSRKQVKGKAVLLCAKAAQIRGRDIAVPTLEPGTAGRWVVNASSRPLYPQESGSVPILQEAGWFRGRSERVRKISPSPCIRTPRHPASNDSLNCMRQCSSNWVPRKSVWSSEGNSGINT